MCLKAALAKPVTEECHICLTAPWHREHKALPGPGRAQVKGQQVANALECIHYQKGMCHDCVLDINVCTKNLGVTCENMFLAGIQKLQQGENSPF